MWEVFNERFGLGAEVVSHSMIAAAPEAEFDEELGRYVDIDSPRAGSRPRAKIPQSRAGAGGRGAQLPQHQPALQRAHQLPGIGRP